MLRLKRKFVILFLIAPIFIFFIVLLGCIIHTILIVFVYTEYEMKAKNVTDDEMVGLWKIETPRYTLYGNDIKKGWEKMQLFLYSDGRFKMTNLTEEYRKQILNPRSDDVNIVIEGNWKVSYQQGDYFWINLDPDSGANFLGCPVILRTENGLKINWFDSVGQDYGGIVWIKHAPLPPANE